MTDSKRRPRRRPVVVARYWAPLLLWMAAIFTLSSLSSKTIESTGAAETAARSFPSIVNQVSVHIVEFGVMAALMYRVAAWIRPTGAPYLWAVVVVATAAYGATDEFHQSFVPGRYASWLDLGYDATGAVAGVAFAVVWAWIWPRLRRAAR